jgi:type IV pilus assembly protein PilE
MSLSNFEGTISLKVNYMSQHTRQSGFSLIELLIVVGIIGIISAVAVPSLLSARSAAQKAAAQGNLQVMLKSEYSLKVSTGRFARISEVNQYYNGTLGQLAGETLTRQNFVYTTVPSSPSDLQLKEAFSIYATGPGPGATPYIFTLDQSGVIVQVSP